LFDPLVNVVNVGGGRLDNRVGIGLERPKKITFAAMLRDNEGT